MSERRKADEAAAAWDARLRGARASSRDRAAFQAWLKQDAEHEAAHDRLQAALSLLRANARLPELSALRSEEHTSELQSLMRISYAVFCLKKKNNKRRSRNMYNKYNIDDDNI